jgi:hypothetical protein
MMTIVPRVRNAAVALFYCLACAVIMSASAQPLKPIICEAPLLMGDGSSLTQVNSTLACPSYVDTIELAVGQELNKFAIDNHLIDATAQPMYPGMGNNNFVRNRHLLRAREGQQQDQRKTCTCDPRCPNPYVSGYCLQFWCGNCHRRRELEKINTRLERMTQEQRSLIASGLLNVAQNKLRKLVDSSLSPTCNYFLNYATCSELVE